MLQQKMQQLFNYQKNKGGIIDIEAEENKLLLITNSNDNTSEEASDVGYLDYFLVLRWLSWFFSRILVLA